MRVLCLVTNPAAPFFQQQVASLEARGVTCDVLSPTGDHSPGDSRSLAGYVRLAVATLRESSSEYDLVHANYGLTAPAALAQVRLPVVLSLWGSDLHGRFGLASRTFARACDEVIVMTPEMASQLDRACHIIPHGVDFEVFRPIDRQTARETVGWPTDSRHVLFPYDPAREVKNYPLAADVVAAVADRFDETVDLRTVDDVPHGQMVHYLNAADALLLTSEREGSPNIVKEALACNVPVVSTDVGDVAFRLAGVSPSAACLSRDALVDALATVLRTDCRSDGRSSVRELSTEHTAARIEGVYRKAVGTEAAPGDGSRSPATTGSGSVTSRGDSD
ncbi:glycosyltransferase [Halobacteriales archaeon Cl-PHB]